MSNTQRRPSRRRQWLPAWRIVAWLVFLIALGSAVGLAYLVNRTAIPQPADFSQANSTVVYFSDGVHEIGGIGEYDRVQIDLAQVPLTTQHAVLAAEDAGFYNHSGFSVTGILRAFWNNITTGSAQGGSTITQQYVKTVYLDAEKSYVRKLKELVLSIKLETSDSKDEIFGNYLNTTYFGRGAYGIQAASRAYFRKDVDKLTVPEAAMLAALLKAPEGFAPEKRLDRLTERWNYVLDQMVANGWLDQAKRDQMTFPDWKKRQVNRLGGTDGYIIAAVKAQLLKLGYDEASLGVSGLKVVTTIDRIAQSSAVKAVNAEGPKTGTDGLRIGLAAIQPGTGAIVAMYGGKDYVAEPLNNATQAIAQAGSTFKPFALYVAAQQGFSLDWPLPGKNGTDINGYVVNNYSKKSFGDTVTLLQATEESINTAYVTLASQVGITNVINAATSAGIPLDTPGIEQNLTFVLGSASPHPLDVADAYATFAAEGVRAEPYLISQITGRNGGLLYQSSPQTSNVLDAEATRVVNWTLQKVVTAGTGSAARALGRPVAGKTGTTDQNKSAWFAGYTPQIAAAVMLVKQDAAGNPISLAGTGGLRSVAGGSFPARIFTAFMKGALADVPATRFTKPTVFPSLMPEPTTPPTDSASATPSASQQP